MASNGAPVRLRVIISGPGMSGRHAVVVPLDRVDESLAVVGRGLQETKRHTADLPEMPITITIERA